ncbi:MAG: branched-chain amino acid ABC transporter permease [Limnochordales bacterium]|nr:branched-chain amino acid ABC transporter permease [Limnochordales bacterium]
MDRSAKHNTWWRWLRFALLGAGLLLLAAVNLWAYQGRIDFYILGILTVMGINIILATSLNLINGFAGQFAIGHAGFMAIGAYVSALLTTLRSLPFLPALIAGGLAAALVGLGVGIPTLRLRGDYLAIATLGLGEIIRVIIVNLPITGGAFGFSGMPPYTNFFWVEGAVVVTLLVLSNFIRSSPGRALLAVREDEFAAETVGVPTTYYKVLAFAIGSFFAGVAGGLFAHYLLFIDPSQFGILKSIEILMMVVLGGLGSFSGSVVAAVLLTALPEFLRGFADYRMVIYSALLILVMLLRPSGLFGQVEIWQLLGDRTNGPGGLPGKPGGSGRGGLAMPDKAGATGSPREVAGQW